jgi:hypothetical protein
MEARKGKKRVGLKFESEEAERFADCLLKASRQKKLYNVK